MVWGPAKIQGEDTCALAAISSDCKEICVTAITRRLMSAEGSRQRAEARLAQVDEDDSICELVEAIVDVNIWRKYVRNLDELRGRVSQGRMCEQLRTVDTVGRGVEQG